MSEAVQPITRRGLFGHIAGAVVLTNAIAGTVAPSPMEALIRRHKALTEAYNAAADIEEIAMTEAATAAMRAAFAEQDAAFFDLLRHRPQTLEEAQRRFAYLIFDRCSPWNGCEATHDEAIALAHSMLPEADA
ncbi:hypothetical protein [Jiella avicenniae]|uniref:Uncharacterized protein n=1 Tax=Jiella avicenniae TaxID=2907202 RepID=A0A9X1NZ94_9HYPH|nr:hypothetical protein [Jiella avicenniae]MCE7026433.1 hypothetical protein [Jiella avicenniae]